jgi:hypothetical protein
LTRFWLAVSVAFAWLFWFAHNGLWAPFSGDDLMNLHIYLVRSPAALLWDNLRYWSTSYRPLGGLFYAPIYRLFGFNPLPFRIVCFALLALNLGLLGQFTWRLSRSRMVMLFALLLAAYHARFVDLYYSTGAAYDLLCYSFYFAAFNLYLGVREQGLVLSSRQLGLIGALYICALNAKEMGVTLPVLLAAYELIYHGRALRQGAAWVWREGRGVAVTGLLTLPYVVGKLTGPDSLVDVPSYRLTVTPGRYLDAFHLYLNTLLYQEHFFRDPNTIRLLLAMLALALWWRSRPMVFAWCFLLISLLPVAFIAHYAGFFLYLPMAGWALYGAVLLETIRGFLVRRGSATLQRISAVAMPVLLAAFLAPYHFREGAKALHDFKSVQPPTRELAAQFLALRPRLPRGARVLLIGDPLPQNEYYALFLTRLVYRDMTLQVEKGSAGSGAYDAVFVLRDGRLVDGAARPVPD